MKKLSKNLKMYICMFVAVFCAMALKAEAANVTSGTLGYEGGISWTYNADTKTLTVTGKDSGLDGSYNYKSHFGDISDDIEVIIMKDCTLEGSASYLFAGLKSLKRIEFDNFNTSDIKYMKRMFFNCAELESLDLSRLNTSNVEDMYGMFEGCSSLDSVDVSGFDTSKVEDMTDMFYGCESLASLDLSDFNTSNVEYMHGMFEGCKSLVSLDLRNFDTSKVTYMTSMFYDCNSLSNLDVSKFNTSNVESMSYMFVRCSSLTDLDLSSFDLSAVREAEYVLSRCDNLMVIYTPKDIPSKVSIELPATFKDLMSKQTTYLTKEFRDTILLHVDYALQVELDATTLCLFKGRNSQLSATIIPIYAPIKEITWTTSDRSVATVDENGKVSALRPGTATIAVRVTDVTGASREANCEVKVLIPVTNISLSPKTLNLKNGETYTLRANVGPDDASIRDITWTTSNKKVVTVDENGKVKAVGPGNATITATAADGSGVSASCEVTVTQKVTGISLEPSVLHLNIGESETVTPNITPVNASNQEVKWSVASSGAQVVTVDSNGKVTAVGAGTATITVRTTDGSNLSATCEVTVTDPKRMVRAFVERMYTIVLNRAAEAQGLDDWTERLMAKEIDGATLVDMFVNSDEFINRNTSDEEYIKIMYRAVLGREADADGLKMWKDMLADDWTRDYILEGLVLSTEFKNICDSYGIIAAFEPTAESQVRSFVKRMYTVVLNRRADVVGLEDWTRQLMNGTVNGAQVADGFISSQEFANRNLSNEKYVKVLYRAFFNREPDEGGFNVWMNELAKGTSRRDVMKGFVHSVEFSDLCAQYGIIRGEIQ